MKKLDQISTSELALFLGVSMPYVSNIKAGRTKVSAKVAQRISEEFGVHLWEIRPDIYPKHLFENEEVNGRKTRQTIHGQTD